jgi:capsular polysaccharide biosynthesis protein
MDILVNAKDAENAEEIANKINKGWTALKAEIE